MSEIVELRQYTLKTGQRDILIDLFEREFVESQEALGMEVIGTFRDADNPDRFVWLRGFPNMESRARSLGAFYGGPVWKAHRDAANATMLDSDDVLLLRPAWNGADFRAGGNVEQSDVGAVQATVAATICYFDHAATETSVQAFRSAMPTMFDASNARFLGAFVTDPSPNTFPALPVREGQHVFVWFLLFGGTNAPNTAHLPREMEGALARSPEILRLLPTARSRLSG